MRTTIDLPEDLLHLAKSMARGGNQTLSQAVAELMRRGIKPPQPPKISTSPITGLAVMTLGGPPLTDEDVRAMEEEEDEYLASFLRPAAADK